MGRETRAGWEFEKASQAISCRQSQVFGNAGERMLGLDGSEVSVFRDLSNTLAFAATHVWVWEANRVSCAFTFRIRSTIRDVGCIKKHNPV